MFGAVAVKLLEDLEKMKKKRKKEWDAILPIVFAQASQMNAEINQWFVDEILDDDADATTVDHRTLPRNPRRYYDHDNTGYSLRRDYMGPEPLFYGKQFEVMFRISKFRLERLMQDIGAKNIPFYSNTVDALGKPGVSLEAKLLLPLKSMAYGVPSHCFRDYFQMSETMARECCIHFDEALKEIYSGEYLRYPTAADLHSIAKLHKAVHQFDGMLGSLDCMHTHWKNCPVGWQGSYKGKEKKPTIVLEAIADYHMWFWHAAYGYAGTLNDRTILNMSPFLDMLVDGSFEDLEKEAAVAYTIGGDEFTKMYILVDGIYPKYSRFVHGIKQPSNKDQKKYTKWQEASRKDIERAFGVLQGKWQCMARPMHQMDLTLLGNRVASSLILHNMCVSDRVMDDVHAIYDPAESVVADQSLIEYPTDLHEKQGYTAPDEWSVVGLLNGDANCINALTRLDRWNALQDKDEFSRLHMAIQNKLKSMRMTDIA
jgi:Plant transposon protein